MTEVEITSLKRLDRDFFLFRVIKVRFILVGENLDLVGETLEV